MKLIVWLFKILFKLVWWIILKPIVIFTLLFLFIGYHICRWSMTLLLRIWYPKMKFGDWGFQDSSYHNMKGEE